MPRLFLSVHQLTYAYPTSVTPVIKNLNCQFEIGWTGIVGPNGCGKTTLLKLITGHIQADEGQIVLPGKTVYCEQRTDSMPAAFPHLMQDYSRLAIRLKNQLKIGDNWKNRWHSLSHGERKRIQLAVALFQEPDVLAIDEPTNHLDQEAQHILFNALSSFRGIGLLVSHDRQLLDDLCAHTLFMHHSGNILRKGNYSTTYTDLQNEEAFKAHQAESIKRQIRKLNNEIKDRQHKAAQANQNRSKKHIDKKDHDAKAKKDLGRLTGKGAVEGQIKKRLESRMHRLEASHQTLRWQKQSPVGIRINSSAQTSETLLFHLQPIEMTMGDRTLAVPDIQFKPGERVGLIGPNGTGKSTLFRSIVDQLPLKKENFIYIPQEIDSEAAKNRMETLHTFAKDQIARLMTIISRLGSDPEQLLRSTIPSPGEMRKLMLAQGLMKNLRLIIMDEPTNHMDLPSIESVEQALNQCTCAMLLVSHDLRSLSELEVHFWKIEEAGEKRNKVSCIET